MDRNIRTDEVVRVKHIQYNGISKVQFGIRAMLLFLAVSAVLLAIWQIVFRVPTSVLELVEVVAKIEPGTPSFEVHEALSIGSPEISLFGNPQVPLNCYERWKLDGRCELTIFYDQRQLFSFAFCCDRFGNPIISRRNDEGER